jgi:hypothetical protein
MYLLNLLQTALGNEILPQMLNVTLTTNLLQFAIDSVSIEAGGNVFLAAGAEQELETTVNNVGVDIGTQVDLVGLQLNTFLTSVDAQAVTIATLSTNLLQTSLGDEVITADANVNVSTNLIQTALGNEDITADANVTLSTNLLQTALGNETICNCCIDVLLTTNLIQSNSGSVVIGIGVPVTGVQMQISTKTPVVVAWAVVDINVTNAWTTVSTNTTNTWSVVDIAA